MEQLAAPVHRPRASVVWWAGWRSSDELLLLTAVTLHRPPGMGEIAAAPERPGRREASGLATLWPATSIIRAGTAVARLRAPALRAREPTGIALPVCISADSGPGGPKFNKVSHE
eukprot:SAG22_NODE_993_length_6123_cov_15.091799_5_plen_115_part_00